MDERKDFFDGVAPTWDHGEMCPHLAVRFQELVSRFELEGASRVLDVGAGTGVLHPFFARMAPFGGVFFALDYSYPMIARAEAKKPDSRFECLQGDAGRLPFLDDSFERVICFGSFPHFSDPAGALEEFKRVLRPAGILFIAHLFSRSELERHHAGHHAVRGDLLPDEEQMHSLFTHAGFSSPRIENRPGLYLARGVKS